MIQLPDDIRRVAHDERNSTQPPLIIIVLRLILTLSDVAHEIRKQGKKVGIQIN